MGGREAHIDFTSNDYLSLSLSPLLRSLFLRKLTLSPKILGAGGSRLLTPAPAHTALEARLARFFGVEGAVVFNSGFDANVGFFACVPQVGDWVVYDEYIHASVHDGMRASRLGASHLLPFQHNSLHSLRSLLLTLLRDKDPGLREGRGSVFIAVESLYSMDGTFAPLPEIVGLLEGLFPRGNAYLVVDEAHATGVFGPLGRGRVAELGLEGKVLARLCTFGKALAATGAVVLTSILIKDYLLNYARPLIYTTALNFANIIAVDCSFDLLEDGTATSLANDLLALSTHFTSYLLSLLTHARIPPSLLSLPPHLLQSSSSSSSPNTPPPSPIIPLHTTHPRPLSAYLLSLGMNARPITWPTVPKGRGRVRVCLHAGNTRGEVEGLARGVVGWAEGVRWVYAFRAWTRKS
ncbi:pyridoxal phosphate-dependent transferase [Lyophyllum atratum]|nr:pyridoxal phosphate-dependent transferase [Lyophyllum atratum]